MAKKKSKDPAKMGRPTKYEPAYCERLVEHMSEGGGKASFAAKIGVDRDTVKEWANVHADFSAAVKRGEAALELWFEELFKRMAAGQLTRVAKKNKDGSLEYVPANGNAAAAIFMAQNMTSWRNRKAIELTGDGGGPVNYTDVTVGELKRIVKQGLEILGLEIDDDDK